MKNMYILKNNNNVIFGNGEKAEIVFNMEEYNDVLENLETNKYEKKLKREQRKLSRRCKLAKDSAKKLSDSKNYQKQKKKVAKIHNKIRNKHDIICIEDLNIKGMLKNHKLAKSISDVSWSEFVRQLEYKANWYERKIIKVPTFYPSSKTCSSCGNIKETLTLSERIYHCECCGLEIDRDYNASINILRKGKRRKSKLGKYIRVGTARRAW